MDISMGEGPLKGADVFSATNKYGDEMTLSVPLVMDGDDLYEVMDAKLQGFVGEKGLITEHCEDPGVYEIYFPLSGRFTVMRGGEEHILDGKYGDINDIKREGTITVDDEMGSASLEIKTADGKEQIKGFIIPPGTRHSTQINEVKGQIARYVTRYVAVKLRRKDT